MPSSPVSLTSEQLNDMLEAAAERGARRALESVGLHDDEAGKDIKDLRTLIDGWRSTKRAAVETFVKWTTVGLLTLIATSFWLKLGVKLP